MALEQAVGTATVLAVQKRISVQKVSYKNLLTILQANGQVTVLTP